MLTKNATNPRPWTFLVYSSSWFSRLYIGATCKLNPTKCFRDMTVYIARHKNLIMYTRNTEWNLILFWVMRGVNICHKKGKFTQCHATRPDPSTRPEPRVGFFPGRMKHKDQKIYKVVKFCKVMAEYTGRMLKEAMQRDKDRFVLNWIVLDSSNLGIFVWCSKYIISGTLGFSDELLVQQVCHGISPAYGAPPAALPCQFQKMLPCPSKLLYKQLPDKGRLYAGGAELLFLRWDGDLKEVSAETSQVGAAGDSPKCPAE